MIISSVEGTDVDVPALVERSRRNGLRTIGPASMGVASPLEGSVWQAALVDVAALGPGKVAFSLQSGSLGAGLLQLADQLSLGIAWFVSLGDKSDVSGNDLLQFWEDDARITVIAMYTESFGNPRQVRPHRPADQPRPADRRRPRRRRGDRIGQRGALPGDRADRGARGAGDARHGARVRRSAVARRSARRRADQLAQPRACWPPGRWPPPG